MNNKIRNSLIILFLFLFVIIVVKVCIFDNPDNLFIIAEGFDDPSLPYSMTIDRIYRIEDKNDFSERIITYLKEGKNTHLLNHYIRFLGVLGEIRALPELFNIYETYKNDPNYRATIYELIMSFGLISDTKTVQFLENILEEPEKSVSYLFRPTIVCSLYLSTGRTDYKFKSSSGIEQKIYLTKELINDRAVIMASKRKRRTYDQMIILDKLYRLPKK